MTGNGQKKVKNNPQKLQQMKEKERLKYLKKREKNWSLK